MESKYQKGKIYKIVDIGYKKCYIGSTCESLSQRLARHVGKYKVYKKGNITNTRSFDLFDEFGIDNCKIELIENYPCNSKEELKQREGHYIKNNDCVNKCVPCRTSAEYYQDEHEYCLFRNRIYKELHKEEDREYHKKYYQDKKHILFERHLCVCGKYYTLQHIRRHERSNKHQEWLNKQNEE